MIHYAFFQALNPDHQFPSTPFNLKLNDVRYHLPVPQNVADYLAGLLSPRGPFRKLDLCNPEGIETLRTRPEAFELDCGMPTYAESEMNIQSDHGAWSVHEIAVSSLTAAEIERFAIEGQILMSDVTLWLMQNSIYFQHCGGFVLARLRYCFNADDKAVISRFADGIRKPTATNEVAEQNSHLGLFRKMLETMEA
jgi:hypothetical protein